MLWLPLAAALVLLFVPGLSHGLIRYVALAASIGSFVLSLVVIFSAKFTPALQWEENFNWLPSVGIRYHLGTDGLSTLFLLLTGFTSVIACVASWESIKTNIRPYFVTLLLLETGMYGVFMTFDLFMFYVFWELVLIPMALIIGVWGSANRVYAAIKFFLYTLAGSLLMLVAIVATYQRYLNLTGTPTLNVLDLANPPLQQLGMTFSQFYPLNFQYWVFAA